MREIYIKILRNIMAHNYYYIFRVNSKKNFSSCIFHFFLLYLFKWKVFNFNFCCFAM